MKRVFVCVCVCMGGCVSVCRDNVCLLNLPRSLSQMWKLTLDFAKRKKIDDLKFKMQLLIQISVKCYYQIYFQFFTRSRKATFNS